MNLEISLQETIREGLLGSCSHSLLSTSKFLTSGNSNPAALVAGEWATDQGFLASL